MASSNMTLLSGYDLPVRGLDNGFFYPMHIAALISISFSFCCVCAVLILSMKTRKSFFSRPKNDRFVVYLAICDGGFNIFHSMDHLHYLITMSHPAPLAVCSFYSFMFFTFVMSQMLCVNIIAINAFVMMYFGRNMGFGKYDYRLLIYMFGVPIGILIISAFLDKFGPNGYFCAFDGVTGGIVLIVFTTAPSVLILVINCILYVLIWQKIHVEAKRIQGTIGKAATSVRATHRAVKTMMLFVIMFVIQWTAASVFGVWEVVATSPPVLALFTVILSNLGGLLNGIVFVAIYKKTTQTDSELGGKSKVPTVTTNT